MTPVRRRSFCAPAAPRTLVLVLGSFIAACGSDDDDDGGGGGDPPLDFAVCQSQSESTEDGVRLLRCDEAFADAPYVRLPADDVQSSGASTLYLAFNPLGDHGTLIARDGTAYELLDAAGNLGSQLSTAAHPGLRYGTYRFFYWIYEIKGVIEQRETESGRVNALTISAARPVVSLASDVLDRQLLGAWEGTVTVRTGEGTYDPEQTVPIRLELTDLGDERGLLESNDVDVVLAGHALRTPTGVVANATAPVGFADGSCPAPLGALGDGAPFTGASDAVIKIYRFPAMHVPGDYQLVVDYPVGSEVGSGMSSWLPASPAALMQLTPTTFGPLVFGIHGAPNGFRLELERVSGGGGACAD